MLCPAVAPKHGNAKHGGPTTELGKTVAARNATSHGVFARDIVLPHLGEDPDGYRQMQDALVAQLHPGNLLEQHYVEKIAAASWRLRRLHRWQAQLFEDDTLTEDQRLDKLDKVLRHETALHRQIDTAVKMLTREAADLYTRRARAQALRNTLQTELDCREQREAELEVTFEARDLLKTLSARPELDYDRLDTVVTENKCSQDDAEICENELPPEPLIGSAEWHAQADRLYRESLLETLKHDISEILPDGRPVYLDEADWLDLQQRLADGEVRRVAELDALSREEYLYLQELAREVLAETPESSPTPLSHSSPLSHSDGGGAGGGG